MGVEETTEPESRSSCLVSAQLALMVLLNSCIQYGTSIIILQFITQYEQKLNKGLEN